LGEQIQGPHSQPSGAPSPEQSLQPPVLSAVPEVLSYATPRRRATNRSAIYSLCAGIAGLPVPMLGIVAIVLGLVGLRKARDPSVGGRGLAIAGIVLGIVGTIWTSLMLFDVWGINGGSPETANRVKCASNMRQLCMAMTRYADENGARFPDDLGILLAQSDLRPSVAQCPSVARDRPDSGLAGAPLAAWANANTDYVYLGWGRRVSSDLETVILYELPRDHRGDGANVAFLDGHVEWISAAKLTTLLASQARPTTQPARP
jgi:prepilin-type processing-associated H-X9-DG protein